MTESDDTQREDVNFGSHERIGPYRLLEPIGAGAMGEVWRAEQERPVRRIVAIKFIKKGMDTREVITRFEIERQAMALMDHPSIPTVFDAGEAPDGRPYIVMEYVAGERITDYCERTRMSIEDRLRLVQKVCLAMQHAHQKAVLHRDLKPANILVVEVDGEPVPKIIDFGIAKATTRSLTERSAATFIGQMVGTPLYMSPEQVATTAAGVDTRADVYSLGVILYELLSGALPYDPEQFAKAGLDAVLAFLRDVEAPRPSTRVSTLGDRTAEVAAHRGLDPKKLQGVLRGDLDWITLKALEKDRKRRYESTKEFADDIERYLTKNAILARPPSTTYRASRFVRRHRVAVGASALSVVLLVALAVWQTVQARIIATERDRAVAFELLSYARSELAHDPTAAAVYALASYEAADLEETRQVIRTALGPGPLRRKLARTAEMGRNSLAVDASPDGRYAAAGWSWTDRAVVLHDLHTGSWRWLDSDRLGPRTGTGWQGWWDVVFTSDGRHVVAAGTGGVSVWRVDDGFEVARIPPDSFEATGLGQVHAVADADRVIMSGFLPGTGTLWYELALSSGTLTKLGATPGEDSDGDGNQICGVSPDARWFADFAGGRLFLQERSALGTDAVIELGTHEGKVFSTTFDPKGRFLASADDQGGIVVWDLAANPPRRHRELWLPLAGNGIVLVFDRHRSRFLAASHGEEAIVFELTPGPPRDARALGDFDHWTHDGAFLPDGSIVTARNGGLGLAIFPPPRGIEWSLGATGKIEWPFNAAITPDTRSTYLWTSLGRVLRFTLDANGDPRGELIAQTPPVNRADSHEWRANTEATLALLMQAFPTHLLNLRTGEQSILDRVPQEFRPFALSPSGRFALFVELGEEDERSKVRIVETASGETTHRFEVILPDAHRVSKVGLYPDPRLLEDRLLVLEDTEFVQWELQSDSTATRSTLWSSPTSVRGVIVGNGEALVVAREGRTVFVDLTNDTEVDLGPAPVRAISWARWSGELGLIAVGFHLEPGCFVRELRTGKTWRLPAHDSYGTALTGFDPLGRWLYVHGAAWMLPLDPAFLDEDRESTIERLRAMTNLRVVPDPTGQKRYQLAPLPEGEWPTGMR